MSQTLDFKSLKVLKDAVEDGYTPLEYRACQIGLIYEKMRNKYFSDPYRCLNKEDPRKSKGFPHFYKLARMESERRDLFPDMSLFIRAQFEINRAKSGHKENDVPIPPNHLHTNLALERYRDYILNVLPRETYNNSTKPRPEEKVMIRSMGQTAKFLLQVNIDLFDSTDVNYLKLMNYQREDDSIPLFFLYVVQNFISKYFLCASKSYRLWLQTLDRDLSYELPQDLKLYRENLIVSPKAIEFGRQAFGSEFNL